MHAFRSEGRAQATAALIGLGTWALILSFQLFRWPIVALDNDLWYHLSGGRYIVQHGAPALDSFFSFLSPPRHRVNHYWLFQLLVYGVHAGFGYKGLIVFRTLAYVATASLIGVFLLKGRTQTWNRGYLAAIVLLACYALFLIPRCLVVRPHLVTYLCLVLLLLLCETAPQRLLWFVPVAVLWMNMHGIVYPVLLVVVVAYFAESLIEHLRSSATKRPPTTPFLLGVWGCLAGIFLTPAGAGLLGQPFISTAQASHYISEFRQLTPYDFLVFNFSPFASAEQLSQTIFNLVALLACVATLTAYIRRQGRLSHALLCVTGLFLLLKGERLRYECLLLMLPILRTHLPLTTSRPSRMQHVGAALLIAVIFFNSWRMFANRPRFPLSYEHLPAGVVTFLKAANVGGTILNHPNMGGYLQWELFPQCTIFMDMEVPHLFTDDDMFVATHMFADRRILRRVLEQYDPSFLVVPFNEVSFPSILVDVSTQYVPVFFDDASVLYVNHAHHSELAARHELTHIDPFVLKNQGVLSVLFREPKERTVAVNIARRLLLITPDCLLLNHLVTMAYYQDGVFDHMLPFTDVMIASFPEIATGFGLKGDALQGLGLYDKAISSYRECLKRASPAGKAEIYLQMGLAYSSLHQYARAYGLLKHVINPFSTVTDYRGLYNLALAAAGAGRHRQAAMLFQWAFSTVPLEDKVWHQRLQALAETSAAIRNR